ncbi:MAG: potassium transporter Kup [Alphaproteobacteria bacterium]|nr:potassium transporter Kup [Alphaproteobacteria bacterium]
MAEPSAEIGSGEADQPAFAKGPATEQVPEADGDSSPSRGSLVLAALGVVFGDIGTSPVYTFRECFNPEYGLAFTEENVLGVLSCLIWALILVVAVKYVLLIMRADNQGEGGIFALLALALWGARGKRLPWLLTMLGLAGASLFYGDSMITPAISVLSAVEGLEVAIPALKPFVLPLTVVVLLGLFVVQKRGTERVGEFFGPVMALWFAVLAVLGLTQIAAFPRVLTAISPIHAVDFFTAHPAISFVVLGAVALAITGGEALYADMGHFGRFPIKTAWFVVVMPALALNYLGQGALVLADKGAIENPFFRMASDWAILPLVLLATAATVIASQAVISGAFSLTRQAMQLDMMPRLDVFQTSAHISGQIYIPQINWLLLAAVLALVLGFQSSSALAAAYGFAVTGTMVITTVLATAVAHRIWGWSWSSVAAAFVPLGLVDLALFSSNALKVPSGGWFPLAIGVIVFTVMSTWREGRQLVSAQLSARSVPLPSFLATQAAAAEARVSGTAIYLTNQTDNVPVTLLTNFKHNKILHSTVLFVRVVTENVPRVAGEDRVRAHRLDSGFWQIDIHFGFAQTPNVPRELGRADIPGLILDPGRMSFFVGRSNVKSTARPGMARWRERFYAGLARIATRPTEFFRIPPDQVIELGAEVEI